MQSPLMKAERCSIENITANENNLTQQPLRKDIWGYPINSNENERRLQALTLNIIKHLLKSRAEPSRPCKSKSKFIGMEYF